MKKELDSMIDTLKEIKTLKKLSVSDEIIFSEACSFIRGQLASKSRSQNKPQTPDTPPSKKQINFLKKNGYEGDLPLTKKEATQLISDFIENMKRSNI